MLNYLTGTLVELTPTNATIEINGIGYELNISLHSFTQLNGQSSCKIFVHQVIREDAHLLFGFASTDERIVFRQLISVSGIGANTARMILSSLTPNEVRNAIASANVTLLQSIKGIGGKTAQRIIVDLKDKISKSTDLTQIFKPADNTIKKEALSALEILGFSRKQSEKAIEKIILDNEGIQVDEVIKKALKLL
jgi:holliday junction DNA helicase RuvA